MSIAGTLCHVPGIDVLGRDHQRVPAVVVPDAGLPTGWSEGRPQAGDVDLHQVPRARRRRLAPELVDEPIRGQARGGGQQQGQQPLLLVRAERDLAPTS